MQAANQLRMARNPHLPAPCKTRCSTLVHPLYAPLLTRAPLHSCAKARTRRLNHARVRAGRERLRQDDVAVRGGGLPTPHPHRPRLRRCRAQLLPWTTCCRVCLLLHVVHKRYPASYIIVRLGFPASAHANEKIQMHLGALQWASLRAQHRLRCAAVRPARPVDQPTSVA